jgi:hypothetical protein
MKNSTVMIAILVAIIVGGGAFFGGMKYQQSKQRNNLRQFTGQNGQRLGNGGNQMGFRPVNGEILSSDEKSITVKLQDGSSKIVLFSDKTTINKAAEATKEDLKAGEKVAVFGQENSDGSVTAQNIQLNPINQGLPNQDQNN